MEEKCADNTFIRCFRKDVDLPSGREEVLVDMVTEAIVGTAFADDGLPVQIVIGQGRELRQRMQSVHPYTVMTEKKRVSFEARLIQWSRRDGKTALLRCQCSYSMGICRIHHTENDRRIGLVEVFDQGRSEIGKYVIKRINGDHALGLSCKRAEAADGIVFLQKAFGMRQESRCIVRGNDSFYAANKERLTKLFLKQTDHLTDALSRDK